MAVREVIDERAAARVGRYRWVIVGLLFAAMGQVPEVAGVLSALGLVASEERRDFVRSHLVPLAVPASCHATARRTSATRDSRSS